MYVLSLLLIVQEELSCLIDIIPPIQDALQHVNADVGLQPIKARKYSGTMHLEIFARIKGSKGLIG